MTAQRIPVLSIAWWRLSRVSWWYSWDPWEKLKRATFIPALRSFSTIGTDLEAGPRVQTIFVFGLCSIIAIAKWRKKTDTELRIEDRGCFGGKREMKRDLWREIWLGEQGKQRERIWERMRDLWVKSLLLEFFLTFEVKNEKWNWRLLV